MLEDALKDLGEGSGDGHVEDLSGRVRSLMKDGNGDEKGDRRAYDDEKELKMQAIGTEVEVRSGEGWQAGEETEKVPQLRR